MREMMRSNLKIRETGRRKIGEARQEGKEEMERGEREKKGNWCLHQTGINRMSG